jgi:alkanesulfonate monooxygenase SsuD/methylene tetrahydromethanopterin reductase-like flavin-dependent oxidoreductase (luciferase family)
MLWTEDDVSFSGRYYTLTRATQNPKPVQRPHPRIWVGGAGEQLTLRVVAEHADVWNVIGPVDEVVRKAAVLDEHCAAIGRDPSTIARSVQPRLDPDDPVAIVDVLHAYYEAGFTENVVYIPPVQHPVRIAEVVAEQVLPAFSDRRSRPPARP